VAPVRVEYAGPGHWNYNIFEIGEKNLDFVFNVYFLKKDV
jgi:hypothetical protein